jgi:hypothetical protein
MGLYPAVVPYDVKEGCMRRYTSLRWIKGSYWIALVLLTFISGAAGQNAQDADEPIPLEQEENGVQIGSECDTRDANTEGGAQCQDAEEKLGEECSSDCGKEKAHVGFGRVIEDKDVLNIVREHYATLKAVHMWSNGFSGTYRSYKPTSSDKLLREARRDSIAHLANGLKGNNVRLQKFAEHYSDPEVAQDPDLQHQLRSLLGIRARMRNTLTALRRGSPVIYSVEVEADIPHLEKIEKDARLFAFNRSTLIGGKAVLERTPKPEA